jgi:hypothetical protein
MGVNTLRTTGYPSPEHTAQIRGFAVILHESEYLDLIARHTALDRGDYEAYLAGIHRRMASARRTGKQVLVGPFLTDQYESYADAIGEPPCSFETLRSYDDFVARIGPHTITWAGEPISSVLAHLRGATDTSTDEAKLLPLLKQAADLHVDPQRAASQALDAATEIFAPLLKHTEPGHHTLTCVVQFPRERVSYELPVMRTSELVAFPDGGPEQLLWAALATAQLSERPATLILRSRRLTAHTPAAQKRHSRHPESLTVRAWRLSAGRAIPLTAAQAFALACTDPATGDPVPPEPGACYEDAFPLGRQAP